jgi:SAM-dependent methyltransferase
VTQLPSTDFDHFSSHYEEALEDPIKRWFGGNSSQYYLKLKADELCQHLRRLGLEPRELRALDVGCGTGVVMNMLEHEFLELSGVDSSKGMIETARERSSKRLSFEITQGNRLPFGENQFDVVYSMSLFHHVPKQARLAVLQEMTRVVRNGGWIVNFEHNALNPLTRWVVKRCPLDRGVTLLWASEMASLCLSLQLREIHTRFILFFPKALQLLRTLEAGLFWCPMGGQFYVAARKKSV